MDLYQVIGAKIEKMQLNRAEMRYLKQIYREEYYETVR